MSNQQQTIQSFINYVGGYTDKERCGDSMFAEGWNDAIRCAYEFIEELEEDD